MYVNRFVEKKLLDEIENDKVLIILGPRQVGKTTLVKHLLTEKNIRFLNLDLNSDQQTFEAFSKLPPKEAREFLDNPEIVVIDEAQKNFQTSRVVKGFWDSGIKIKFILLGSSTLDIKKQAAESLVGRNEKIY